MKHAFVQYYFDGKEHPVEIKAHGNSKKTMKPFRRTMASTLKKVKKSATIVGGETATREVNEEAGGPMFARSSGALVRDRKQAYNAKFRSSERQKSVVSTVGLQACDPYAAVMVKCNATSSNQKVAFVRKVELAPEPRIVLATENQLCLLDKFTTNAAGFSILTADPTFSCGQFDVTCVAFQHLMLTVGSDTSKHPLLIGPIYIHHRKLYETYSSLFSTLKSFRPNLKNVQAFGTDGEINLLNRCLTAFPVHCS